MFVSQRQFSGLIEFTGTPVVLLELSKPILGFGVECNHLQKPITVLALQIAEQLTPLANLA